MAQQDAAEVKINEDDDEKRDDDQVLLESKAEEPDFDEQELNLAKKVKNMEQEEVYHIEKT